MIHCVILLKSDIDTFHQKMTVFFYFKFTPTNSISAFYFYPLNQECQLVPNKTCDTPADLIHDFLSQVVITNQGLGFNFFNILKLAKIKNGSILWTTNGPLIWATKVQAYKRRHQGTTPTRASPSGLFTMHKEISWVRLKPTLLAIVFKLNQIKLKTIKTFSADSLPCIFNLSIIHPKILSR